MWASDGRREGGEVGRGGGGRARTRVCRGSKRKKGNEEGFTWMWKKVEKETGMEERHKVTAVR